MDLGLPQEALAGDLAAWLIKRRKEGWLRMRPRRPARTPPRRRAPVGCGLCEKVSGGGLAVGASGGVASGESQPPVASEPPKKIAALPPEKDVLKQMAAEYPCSITKVPPMALVTQIVARDFGITSADLGSPQRQRRYVVPRFVAMFLIFSFGGRSINSTARWFGGRDHTTVLNALRKMRARMAADPEFAARVETLRGRTAEAFAPFRWKEGEAAGAGATLEAPFLVEKDGLGGRDAGEAA